MLLASSCQDEDFGYTSEQIAYKTNFEKSFGNIASDQIWDFSTYNLTRLGLEGGPSIETTRASYTGGFKVPLEPADASKISVTLNTHFELGAPMLDWLNTNLTEKVNHRNQGKNFLLSTPESGKDFLFIPIYQGHAGMEWELHLVAAENGGNSQSTYYDYTIWSKSDGVEYKIDYNKSPEFYYSHENTTTQFLEWRDGYHGGQLCFADAVILNNGNATIGDGPVSIKFGLPKGKEVHGQFKIGDQLLTVMVDGEVTENFDFDNTQGSEFKTYEVVVGYCQGGQIKDFFVPTEDENNATPDPTGDKADTSPMLAPRRRAAASYNEAGHDVDLKKLVWNFWNVSIENEGYPGLNSYEDDTRIRIYTQFDYVTDWINADLSFQTGHTMDRAGVRAHPIQLKSSEMSRNFLLYLKITKGVDGYASTGTCQRSDEGMMLALTECNVLSQPNNQARLNQFVDELGLDRGGKDAQYMVLGVEDANQGGSDWDINDVVFLVVGLPDAPDIKQQLVKKRYLIEDLGSTYDFDFNDIVVDVTQEQILHPDGDVSPKRTYAQLKHLCGTIPFRVKIGNTILGTSQSNPSGIFAGQNAGCGTGGKGFNPVGVPAYSSFTQEFDIPDGQWDPDANNITVTSWPSYAGNGTWTAEEVAQKTGWGNTDNDGSVLLHPMPETAGETYGFPEVGKFPYIIACDQTVMWMDEEYTVPRSWFKTWPKSYDDYLDNGGHSGDDPIVPDEDDPADTNDDKYITWDTEYNFGNMYWDFNAKLTPKRFKNVNVGDIITIYYENANDAKIQLDVIVPWTFIIQSGLAGGAGTYNLTVTEDLLPQLKSGGLAIKGENYVFKKVTCAAPQYWEFFAGVAAGCEGMGTVTYTPKKDNYLDGETVHVVAAPAEGYKFVSWSDGETFKSMERDVVITASTENIYATFAPAAKFSVKISAAEGGQISINGGAATNLYQVADVYEGTKIVVKAVPGSGYKFAGWSDNDPQGATRTLYVYGNTEFSATFEETDEVTIDAKYTPGGTISLSNAFAAYGDANKNITVTFTLPAGTGFNGRLVVGNHVSSVSIPNQQNDGSLPAVTTFIIDNANFKTALANQTTKEVTFYVDWDRGGNLTTKGDVGIKLTW